MILLYFASQTGRYISKLAFFEFEYRRAIIVNGHDNLKKSKVVISNKITIYPIQSHLSILLMSTAYSIYEISKLKKIQTKV